MSGPQFTPGPWPEELTPELTEILGRPNFSFIHLSRLYRAAGYSIPPKAEVEQAFFIHRFLRAWFRDPDKWDSIIDAENEEVRQAALAKARGEQ